MTEKTDISPSATPLPSSLQALPMTLTIRVGTAKRTIREIMSLDEGSVVKLSTKIDDPIEICIEDRVIARGELIAGETEDDLAVRLTELVETGAV